MFASIRNLHVLVVRRCCADKLRAALFVQPSSHCCCTSRRQHVASLPLIEIQGFERRVEIVPVIHENCMHNENMLKKINQLTHQGGGRNHE